MTLTQSKAPWRKVSALTALVWLGMGMTIASSAAPPASRVPLINQPLVPDAVAPGGPGLALAVNGTGFVAGSTVNWNATPLQTTFVSSSHLTAEVPASDLVASGTASVTVTNPGVEASNVAYFSITDPSSNLVFQLSGTVSFASGGGVATADFNGDGNLDLAIDGIVLLGNGDGTFTPAPYSFTCGGGVVLIADFNGDAKPDIATATSDGTVCISLGNGDGTFQYPIYNSVGGLPTSLAAADFNGDGKLDLAVDNGSFHIPILLGNGDGTFQVQTGPVELGASSVSVGDLNGDGKIDLVAIRPNGKLDVLLGNGDGTFQNFIPYPIGGHFCYSLALADFNGDGKLDAAVGLTNGVSVLLGNGDGTFGPYAKYPTGALPQGLVAGDFNGDGKLDIAVTLPGFTPNSTGVSILLGRGDGTFQNPLRFLDSNYVLPLMVAGDFNNDGRLDLAMSDNADDNFAVLLQLPNPTVGLSHTSLTFPQQLVGATSASKPIALKNRGAATLDISSITLTGTDAASFTESDTCVGASLASLASCTIRVAFRPAHDGPLSANVSISDNAANSPQTVGLTGSATFFTANPGSLNFGSVPVGQTSAPQNVTLTNTAKITLPVSGIAIHGRSFSSFAETNNCGSALGAGASCTFTLTFTPTYATVFAASLGVMGGRVVESVPLSGTGTQ